MTTKVLTFNYCSQATTKEKGCNKNFSHFLHPALPPKLAWTQLLKSKTGLGENRGKCQKYSEKIYYILNTIYLQLPQSLKTFF